MTYEPYSLVIVPFPFTDKVQTKKRPALVLSSIDHQSDTDHITLMMITSAKHSSWKNDYQIEDIEISGLSSPSIIRQKIFTIDSRLIIEKLGKLSEKEITKVNTKIKTHLTIK